MFTDSVLYGEECQIRFFAYPNSLKLYDTDVDCFEFINEADLAINISCFGQEITLVPKEIKRLVNGDEIKCGHSLK